MTITELPENATPAQVAELLNVSRSSIYNWVKSGYLPGFKVGEGWRIRRGALIAWIADRESGAV